MAEGKRGGPRSGSFPHRPRPKRARWPAGAKATTLLAVSGLGIYLNDHLAGATAALELARRTRAQNKGNDVGRYLEGFVGEVVQDRDALRSVMAAVRVTENPAKRAAGWLAEKVGRLKLNGRLVGYSPLSRLEELEALCLGVEGKLSLWKTLKVAARTEPRLAGVDLDRLARRAQQQRTNLQRLRGRAATEAFGGRPAARRRKPAPRKPSARKTTRAARKTTRATRKTTQRPPKTTRAPRKPTRAPRARPGRSSTSR